MFKNIINPIFKDIMSPIISFAPPSVSFNFVSNSSLTSPQGITLGFSRASGAMQIDSKGDIMWAPENIIANSNDFSNPNWAAVGVSTPVLQADGFYLMVETATLSNHQVGHSTSVSTTYVGQVITAEFDVKSYGGRDAYIGSNSASFGSQEYCYYDLTNGVVRNQGTSVISASITRNADGSWHIRWQAPVQTAGLTFGIFILSAQPSDTARAPNFTGSTTAGLYLKNAQANRGQVFNKFVATTGTAYYGPRFDYHPTTITPRGLRIEESRTNLCTYSQDLSNAAWVKTDSTITSNSILSPEGIVNADLVTEGVGGGAVVSSASGTITATDIITFSTYVKRGNHDWIRIILNDSTFTNGCGVWFNTATGLVGTTTAIGTGTYVRNEVISLKNGWYRVAITGTVGAADTTARIRTFSAAADNSFTRVNNGTRYQWGAQIEAYTPTVSAASTTRMTSYIPTGAASTTRSADISTTTIGSWYNQSEGVIEVDWEQMFLNTNALARGVLVNISDGTGNNRNIIFSNAASGLSQGSTSVAGVAQAGIASGLLAANTVYKTAYAYKANDFVFAQNNTILGADTSGTIPTGITQIQLGQRGNDHLNGWIRNFSYYNQKLANSTIQALTI